MRRGIRRAGFAWLLLAAACTTQPDDATAPRITVGGDSPLVGAFTRVADDTGVPAELLAAIAHVETRFRLIAPSADAHGAPTIGLLGLSADELARGAALAGLPDELARTDAEANLRAGAMLLREAAPTARTLDDFLGALPANLRHEVAAALGRGVDGRDALGHRIVIAARPRLAETGFGTATQALGYPGATWFPASSANYQEASRDVGDITNVVIHTTQGSFNGTISWFQNPDAEVSAHYVVRSNDGFVAQMVSEKNIAWHDACFNTHTVGIEHEGFVADPETWYTEAMYVESAKLTAYLCDKYGIAKDHGPIVGHGEAPDCSDHTDPGSGWNWDHYIDLVRTGGAPMFAADEVTVEAPATLVSGERATVTVTITNRGTSAWDLDITRLGTQAPQDRESAFFVDGDWLSPNRATATDTQVAPGETGTFTFDIVAPRVTAPTGFDEAFQLVEEGVTWFGPEVHIQMQVLPDAADDSSSGCAAGGSSTGGALALVALGLVTRRRRRR
ncbi:MAG TPA: N-acetylmuramoyl-L-alanine amidase [Kofleriaceae bacterium]|nr:N-acetylmuramoyl-L-alanine amidase [Kofleriaceae bacterium]